MISCEWETRLRVAEVGQAGQLGGETGGHERTWG